MGKEIDNRVQIWLSSGISVACLAIIGFVYNYSLLKVEHLMTQYEIPLFALVKDYSPLIMFLITVYYGSPSIQPLQEICTDWFFVCLHAFAFPRWLLGLIILIFSFLLVNLAFLHLVQILYPLYGILNLFLLAMILLYPVMK